jgi:signal transduction histidine kinase
MHSLRVKLLIAFMSVALIAVAVAALAALRATDRAFAAYVRQGQSQRMERLRADLADFYAHNQSWTNVQATLSQGSGMGLQAGQGGMMGAGGMMGSGPRSGREGAAGMMATRALLANPQGTIVAWSGTAPDASTLSAKELSTALPITVGGKVVGYLLGQGPGLSTFTAVEDQFLQSVKIGLLAASLIAGGLAIVISLVMARRLSDPLVSMTQAAQAMARGDLDQRVLVHSRDEIGRLAGAFNSMAASLQRAEQLRRNLVADVAHELRTPIAVLRADLEALQDGVYQPSAERLAALREETDILSRLVADLHELSLAEAGQLAMERRPYDLSVICRQAATGMESQATASGIGLQVGQADEGAVSNVDPDRMAQVLRNLISNALRYTPNGGVVNVACRRDSDSNLISVRDSGTGIQPEDLPYVFDRFYRGEKSRARATGGAGLGLAIVKQLVEAQAGRVWVESTPGEGATFFVRLPYAAG